MSNQRRSWDLFSLGLSLEQVKILALHVNSSLHCFIIHLYTFVFWCLVSQAVKRKNHDSTVLAFCDGKLLLIGRFLSQRASYTGSVSISWSLHEYSSAGSIGSILIIWNVNVNLREQLGRLLMWSRVFMRCKVALCSASTWNGSITGLCEGIPPVTGGCLHKRPVMLNFDVSFSLCKLLNKQSRGRSIKTFWREVIWCRCNAPWSLDCGYSRNTIQYAKMISQFLH